VVYVRDEVLGGAKFGGAVTFLSFPVFRGEFRCRYGVGVGSFESAPGIGDPPFEPFQGVEQLQPSLSHLVGPRAELDSKSDPVDIDAGLVGHFELNH
jgi:hypothetical protein